MTPQAFSLHSLPMPQSFNTLFTWSGSFRLINRGVLLLKPRATFLLEDTYYCAHMSAKAFQLKVTADDAQASAYLK